MPEPITKESLEVRLNALEECCPSGRGPGPWTIGSETTTAFEDLQRLQELEREHSKMNNGEI